MAHRAVGAVAGMRTVVLRYFNVAGAASADLADVEAANREIIDLALKITGGDVEAVVTPRRPGDPPAVVASVDRAADALQWKARHDVSDMVESAWTAM